MNPGVLSGDVFDRAAIDWLLASDEPGIRAQARRELLGEDARDDLVRVLDGPKVRALLDGQEADGGFGVNVYRKWQGAHWRLVSLVELGIPQGEPRALAAVETVMHWLAGKSHRASVLTIAGRVRRCASQEGNALAVMSRLGWRRTRAQSSSRTLFASGNGTMAVGTALAIRRPRIRPSTRASPRSGAWRSTRAPPGMRRPRRAAHRAAEFFLSHRLFRSHTTGAVGDPRWVEIHYPPYYTYDILQGLSVLGRAGALPDPRADEAIDLLLEKRLDDGRWAVEGPWPWSSSSLGRRDRDPAQWSQRGPSEMVTLNALRILRRAGR